jgi:hypothetical protein
MCCRGALLALATGKPVKMVNTREESMLESYKRHPYVLYYKWGAKKDGSITAMEIKCIADGGAYASMSPFVTWRSVVQATGPYYCEHVKTDLYSVYTNNNYTGAMRGFGSPQVNFAIESMMDELGEKVGKDPLEIRLQNGFKDGAVTATQQKLTHKVSLMEVLTKATEAADFRAKWRQYRTVLGAPQDCSNPSGGPRAVPACSTPEHAGALEKLGHLGAVVAAASRDGSGSAEPDAALAAPKKRGIGLACSYRGVAGRGGRGCGRGDCVGADGRERDSFFGHHRHGAGGADADVADRGGGAGDLHGPHPVPEHEHQSRARLGAERGIARDNHGRLGGQEGGGDRARDVARSRR